MDLPSGEMTFTVCHGKSPVLRTVNPGKPSISIRAIYTMAILNNQMVKCISSDFQGPQKNALKHVSYISVCPPWQKGSDNLNRDLR
jgi:hypothetical protein